ncbi:MAG: hypothetical protein KGL45_15560 [Gammaproteobacteria bacterium]|nr:hypothetical protein [Gammaproteobacteria bacterium]
MPKSRALLLALNLTVLAFPARPATAAPQAAQRPWLDSSLPPGRRADLALAERSAR